MTANSWAHERRIAIVGAGAIGCRIAAHLAQQGVTTTLFDGWMEHVQALNVNGLILELADGRRQQFDTAAFAFDGSGSTSRFDLVILAVRSDDTDAALPLVQRLLKEDGCVVSCQNGVNEEAIAKAVGVHRTLGCSLVFGARLSAPGQVRVLPGVDVLHTGELVGGSSPRLDEIVALLGACGTSTATYNLVGYRWMKLTLNATGNTLLLLSGMTASQLHGRESSRRLIIALAAEVLGTSIALGIEPEPVLGLPASEWIDHDACDSPRLHQALIRHGEELGARRLSMVADFEARGKTEVDHINGYVIRKARSLGRPVPLNEQVWRMVREMEAGTRSASEHALRELDAVTAAP